MTPILSTTGGGSVRGFGRRRPEPSGPSGPSGPPSNGSFTNDDVTSLTVARTRLNWTNADAAANVYLYRDSVFVSDLGVNATNSGYQTGTLNTSYLYEVSAYKNGIESAKYNMGGAKTLAAYPTVLNGNYGFILLSTGTHSPPSTWNNSNNEVHCVAGGSSGADGDASGAAGGRGGGIVVGYDVTWSGAVAVVVGAGGDPGANSSMAVTPSLTAYYNGSGTGGWVASGGLGGNANGTAGGGGGGAAVHGEGGTNGANAVSPNGGAGGEAYGGAGGGTEHYGFAGWGRGGGGGGGGSNSPGGAGANGTVEVTWGG